MPRCIPTLSKSATTPTQSEDDDAVQGRAGGIVGRIHPGLRAIVSYCILLVVTRTIKILVICMICTTRYACSAAFV
jgi:hypothetical protein